MKDYLLDKKAYIRDLDVKKREIAFPVTKSVAISVIGPRRAGKSFSLFYWIKTKKLKDEDYLFVNFEDDEIKEMKRSEIRKCVHYHVEIYGKEPRFLFFDEIQNLERWESFLYSFIERKRYHIFVTGSSSKLLSRELATQLRGRSMSAVVFPFSFREFLDLNEFTLTKYPSTLEIAKLKHLLTKYIKHTGYPQVLIDGLNPEIFFKEYLEVVIFKDLVERFGIENISALRFFILRAVSNFSKEFSINRVYGDMKSADIKISKKSLYNYARFLEDVLVCFFLKKFYYSLKKVELSVPKVYLCDLGLANYLTKLKFSENTGRLMENLVFIELKKKELRGEIDLYYLKTKEGYEIDFLIKEGLRIKQLIQVTYANDFDEIDKREIRALLHAKDLFKKHKPELLVITWDYEDEKQVSWFGKRARIKFLPLWKWLPGINS